MQDPLFQSTGKGLVAAVMHAASLCLEKAALGCTLCKAGVTADQLRGAARSQQFGYLWLTCGRPDLMVTMI